MTRDLFEKFVPLNPDETDWDGHKSYIVGATAVAILIPKHARGILVQALTQNIRYTLDGINPTTTRGYRLTAGNDPIYIELDGRIKFKVIAETAGAVLEYEFCDMNNGGTLG